MPTVRHCPSSPTGLSRHSQPPLAAATQDRVLLPAFSVQSALCVCQAVPSTCSTSPLGFLFKSALSSRQGSGAGTDPPRTTSHSVQLQGQCICLCGQTAVFSRRGRGLTPPRAPTAIGPGQRSCVSVENREAQQSDSADGRSRNTLREEVTSKLRPVGIS